MKNVTQDFKHSVRAAGWPAGNVHSLELDGGQACWMRECLVESLQRHTKLVGLTDTQLWFAHRIESRQELRSRLLFDADLLETLHTPELYLYVLGPAREALKQLEGL